MSEKRVFAPSAEVHWSGEMGDEFRALAEAKLDPGGNPSRPLSQDAWHGLWRVVFSFASLLATDSVAAPAAAQTDLIRKAAEQAQALMSTLDALDTPEMGRAVSNVLDDAWAAEHDTEGRYVADLAVAKEELASLVGNAQAEELITVWEARLFLRRPWPVFDFKSDLHIFAQAAKHLAEGGVPVNRDPLDDLISMLCRWQEEHGISAGAAKTGGKLVDLVHIILDQVPREPASLRSRRFFHITPDSLAARVVSGRAQYRARIGKKPA